MISEKPPKNKKIVHYKIADDRNIDEWLKYQRYADKNL